MDALRAMRVPAEVIEEARAAIEERNKTALFGVWPEHWHAVRTLCEMATQWRYAGGVAVARVGLDYAALPVVLKAQRGSIGRRYRRPFGELMRQLQVLECAVLRHALK